MLVGRIDTNSCLTVMIALLELHLQKKASPLLQNMNLRSLISPGLRGRAEEEVKMTILTGNSLCFDVSTRTPLGANSSDSLF